MKITIDVSDFYLEDEGLESGLKEYVKREVLSEISKSIEKKVEEHITRKVKDEVEKNLIRQINQKIADLIASEKIIVSGKEIDIVDHIKTIFQNNNGWSSPTESLKNLAKKFGDEMKARYDLLFASQIVAKMNENGLIKEDVAKKLLDGTK